MKSNNTAKKVKVALNAMNTNLDHSNNRDAILSRDWFLGKEHGTLNWEDDSDTVVR